MRVILPTKGLSRHSGAVHPAEIKLEAVFGKAPAQLERLIPRLAEEGRTLVATLYGATEPEAIPTGKILLPTHDGTRIVVTNTARALDALGAKFTPDEVARVTSVSPATSTIPQHGLGLVFWQVEVLVNRQWMEEIVKVSHPPVSSVRPRVFRARHGPRAPRQVRSRPGSDVRALIPG